jgi:hypothetical protein
MQLYGAFDLAGVTGIEQRLTQPSEQPIDCSLLRPRRKLLLTKRSLRCRVCVDAGRPGILVKPQINPLTGDSSMLAKSSWWKKATFASSHLPSLRLVQGATPGTLATGAGGSKSLILLLTNPSDCEVRIVLERATGDAGAGKADGSGAGGGEGEEAAAAAAAAGDAAAPAVAASAAQVRLQKAQAIQKRRAEARQEEWLARSGEGAGGTQVAAGSQAGKGQGRQQKAANVIELPEDSVTIAAWEDPNLLDDLDEASSEVLLEARTDVPTLEQTRVTHSHAHIHTYSHVLTHIHTRMHTHTYILACTHTPLAFRRG